MAPSSPSAASGIVGGADAAVDDWCERDARRVFMAVDRDVIDSTRSVRAVIVEQLLTGAGASRDLLNACGVLGRIIAARSGSPTLAALSIDGAREALGPSGNAGGAWLFPARAAVAEAYAATRAEMTRAEGLGRWEYPSCAVPLHEGIVAVAAGYPEDDVDALVAWASRVASAAAMAGVRRVVVSGSAAARAALADALNMAGIELLPSYAPVPRSGRETR